MKKNHNGFSVVELLIIIVVLGVLGLVGWKVLANKNKNSDAANASSKSNTSQQAAKSDAGSQPAKFIWQQTATGWQAFEKAPECPAQPMLKAPADLSKVTSVLYPGQTRGSYKPHGGLRFDDTKDNSVTVTAPMDGYIVKATRNFAQGTTEVQYGIDVMNNCGVMYRFGHLREIPEKLQKIMETLPPASADSRIESINPPVFIKQGEVVATKTGLLSEKNTFFDWGVYDFRQDNEASKSPAYQTAHANEKEFAWHGVCWLQNGWLPAADQSRLAALPAGAGEGGKQSDYCK